MAETCNVNIQEAEAGGSSQLHSESEGNLGCIRPGLKKIRKKETLLVRYCFDSPDGIQLLPLTPRNSSEHLICLLMK